MKSWKRAVIVLTLTVAALAAAVMGLAAGGKLNGPSPDRPPFAQEVEGNYLNLRDDYLGRLRGIEPGRVTDPLLRVNAVQTRERQERRQQQQQTAAVTPPAWTEIGPDSVTNGQGVDGSVTAVSGRVTAIAVDPTNSSKVYLGTAQGGVWRSLNGGTTWTPIFDSAQSLAIGALAVAPSSPSTVYVGTGEANLSNDSFFGVGLYRIDNADTSATLVGPINPQMTFACNPSVCTGSLTTNAFTGRSISRVLVDPTNAATVFVATSTGGSGLGSNSLSGTVPPVGIRGVYRSTNATAAAGSVTFQKLAVSTGASLDSPATGNRSISDMTFVNDANTLVVSAFGVAAAGDGGIFRSTNALGANPTFTQTLTAQVDHMTFATNGPIVLAASDESSPSRGAGRLRESIDAGATWPTILTAADGFCGGQCFYDIVVGVDPRSTAPNLRIYLGGGAEGNGSTTFTEALEVSSNGGTSFARDDSGVHADTHAIVMDGLTNPSTVWVGNDGGVWKRSATAPAGTLWTNLNNALGTLQYESIAVGKTDPALALGGTQDNGSEIEQTSTGTWSQADFGDGGFALIDQSTTSTSTVTMYHTYFNQKSTLIGFARTNMTSCAVKDGWEGRGFINSGTGTACDGTTKTAANGISGTDNVEFYAPMALGPGTPNILYFGTDRLYRSTDRGDTMSIVSQGPLDGTSPITAIGIAPSSDSVRIVGTQDGKVFRTTTGSSTLTDVTSASFPANPNGSTTNKWVGRAVIDPNNADTAYVTFSFYAPAGQGVWKTTNLSNATPTWTAAGSGIPSVPVNAFAVDPNNSQHLFAGTDVGVYASTDGGSTWSPFGTGLPAVAIFDMKIVQAGTPNESLRVATHGRSIWQIPISAAVIKHVVADFDGNGSTDISVFRPSEGGWYVKGQPPFPVIWGASGDLSVAGDYNGDGTADIAVFRPSEGGWYVKGQPPFPQIWGQSGDVPVPADYNGDGTADIAVFRSGQWYVKGQPPFPQIWGQAGDIPVPGDYNGDGTTDIAVFRPSEGGWYVKGQPPFPQIWGQAGDIPVPGDYNGDGTTDIAVYRPSNGGWYVKGQPPFPQLWGGGCDVPEVLPAAIRSLIPNGQCPAG